MMKYAWCGIVLALGGCAHSYHYEPEIGGAGGQHGPRGEIVYGIPPRGETQLRMTVASLGIKKSEGRQMLGMRLTFQRAAGTPPSARYFLDPAEQLVLFGDRRLPPAYVRAQTRPHGKIELSRPHEVVELLYPLPEGNEGKRDVTSFSFAWRVQYGRVGRGFQEEQTVRFNRVDAAPQQAGGLYSTDPDYPFRAGPNDANEWYVNHDPLWSPFPFQAMP